MRRLIGAVLVLVSVGACAQLNPGVIELTAPEKAEVQKLAEHRKDLDFRRQELQARFQADLDRLNEENQAVNIEANETCFRLQKAHKLDPGVNYQLDEWKGQLVKR